MSRKKITITAISSVTAVLAVLLVGAIVWDMNTNRTSDESKDTNEVVEETVEETVEIKTMTLEEAAAYQKGEIWGRNDETYIVAEPNIYVMTTEDGKVLNSNINGIDITIKQSGDAIYLNTKGKDDKLAYITAGGEVYINDFFSVRYDFENHTFINEENVVKAVLKPVEDVDTGRKTMAVYDNDNRIIVYHEAGAVNGNDAFTVAHNDVCADVSYMLVFAYETIQP